jgi:hypothetical protein
MPASTPICSNSIELKQACLHYLNLSASPQARGTRKKTAIGAATPPSFISIELKQVCLCINETSASLQARGIEASTPASFIYDNDRLPVIINDLIIQSVKCIKSSIN